MSRGNIRDILDLKNGFHLTGSQFYSVALSVARGMNYLHTLSVPIVHGNLSTYNILCQDNWEAKVIFIHSQRFFHLLIFFTF